MNENELIGRQYLTMTVCGERYALPIGDVREVVEYGRVTALPRAAAYLRGIVGLRGRSVPVLDLRRRFGLADAARVEESAIVVVELPGGDGAAVAGLLADAVHEVVEIAPGNVQAPPRFGAGESADFVVGIGSDDAGFIQILALDLVVSEAERAAGQQG
jgi:purine-binding chemotaxis protein CheW